MERSSENHSQEDPTPRQSASYRILRTFYSYIGTIRDVILADGKKSTEVAETGEKETV